MSELTLLRKSVDELRAELKILYKRLDTAEAKNPLIDDLKLDSRWCKISLNNREQYVRNWCVRIVGLSVPQHYIDKYGVDGGCMQFIYERLIYPTLLCATPDEIKELGLDTYPQINKVPEMFQVLENAQLCQLVLDQKRTKNLFYHL